MTSKTSKTEPFNPARPRAETAMEKTTRAANEIIEEQNAQRIRKTARLRKARLEREASTGGDRNEGLSKTALNKRTKKT
jgi:hypothetical protein